MSDIRFHNSAAKHGIAPARARYVIEHCLCPLYSDDPAEKDLVTYLGFDEQGVPLEVIGIELSDGGLLVIHVMRLRQKYERDLARVMECQGQ